MWEQYFPSTFRLRWYEGWGVCVCDCTVCVRDSRHRGGGKKSSRPANISSDRGKAVSRKGEKGKEVGGPEEGKADLTFLSTFVSLTQ